jgi:hypothetical protein
MRKKCSDRMKKNDLFIIVQGGNSGFGIWGFFGILGFFGIFGDFLGFEIQKSKS